MMNKYLVQVDDNESLREATLLRDSTREYATSLKDHLVTKRAELLEEFNSNRCSVAVGVMSAREELERRSRSIDEEILALKMQSQVDVVDLKPQLLEQVKDACLDLERLDREKQQLLKLRVLIAGQMIQ